MKIANISNTTYLRKNNQQKLPKNLNTPSFGRFIVTPSAFEDYQKFQKDLIAAVKKGNSELKKLAELVLQRARDAEANTFYNVFLLKDAEKKFHFIIAEPNKKDMAANMENVNMEDMSDFLSNLYTVLKAADKMAAELLLRN